MARRTILAAVLTLTMAGGCAADREATKIDETLGTDGQATQQAEAERPVVSAPPGYSITVEQKRTAPKKSPQEQERLRRAEAQRREAQRREEAARLSAQRSAKEAQRLREERVVSAERQELARLRAQEEARRAESARVELQRRQAELQDLRDQQAKRDAELQELRTQQEQLAAQLQQERQDREEQLAAAQQAQQEAEARAQEAVEREQQQRAEAEARARQALEQVASVREEARGLVVSLSAPVLFASDEATLLPSARERLDAIANALKLSENQTFRIEGHTDSLGSDGYNVDLSRRRAQVVRDYLVDRGVTAGQIEAVGYGEVRPIASNNTAEGRANNRRVEIVLPDFGMGGAGTQGGGEEERSGDGELNPPMPVR